MPHMKVKCRECSAVMLSCQCLECDADKATRYGTCDECKYGSSALEEVAKSAATYRPRLSEDECSHTITKSTPEPLPGYGSSSLKAT
jgi:predicted ATP-dependent serine protease